MRFTFAILLMPLLLIPSGCDGQRGSLSRMDAPEPASRKLPRKQEVIEQHIREVQVEGVAMLNREGIRACDEGEFERAIKLFTQAIQTDPRHVSSYNNLGRALYWAERYEEAGSVLMEARRLDPEHAGVEANIGDVYRQIGRSREAVDHYHRALDLEPGMARVHYELGNLYLKENKLDLAEGRLKSTLRLDEEFHKARLALIILYHLQGLEQQAWNEMEILEEHGYTVKAELKRAILQGLQEQRDNGRYRAGI